MIRLKDYRDLVSALCLTMFAIMLIVIGGWRFGRLSVKPIVKTIEIEQVYHTGPMPYNTPVWVIYEDDGSLSAYSAIQTDDGSLLPFSISGMPVPYDLMLNPDAWTTLTAGILETLGE